MCAVLHGMQKQFAVSSAIVQTYSSPPGLRLLFVTIGIEKSLSDASIWQKRPLRVLILLFGCCMKIQ